MSAYEPTAEDFAEWDIVSEMGQQQQAYPYVTKNWRNVETTRHAGSRTKLQADPDTDLAEQVGIIRADVDWIKEAVRTILQRLDEIDEDVPDNHDMTPNKIRDLILAVVGLNKPFYPSSLAEEYGLDLDVVHKAVDTLRKEGRIVDHD